MSDYAFEAKLFLYLLENDKKFKIISKTNRSFRIKSFNKKRINKWSYLVNFQSGTIRRVTAYKKNTHIVKNSYYCNDREKVKLGFFNSYANLDTHIKIYNHIEMYKKLVHCENIYKPRNTRKLKEETKYIYGINSLKTV